MLWLGSTAFNLRVLILLLICRIFVITTGSSRFSLGSEIVLSSCGREERIVAMVRVLPQQDLGLARIDREAPTRCFNGIVTVAQ